MTLFRGVGGGGASTDTEIAALTTIYLNTTASATAAATSASGAVSSATAAAISAAAAAASASGGGTSASAAAASATAAASSATNAASSASGASTSASGASTSAANAATSASGASTSATNASASASTASTQATNAATSASTASTQATNAAASATSASGSASSASTSASGASTSATNASNSASNAATSATNASNSATSAATSASNAATSAASIDPATLVKLTGNQTIAGIKTFSSTIVGNINTATTLAAGADRTKLDAITGTNTGDQTNISGNASTVTTNANLTGVVTSVGNTTSLGSVTSAQLAAALTDETGSGQNVFATSPTLVTPALGTPSSGVVTNLTGTASININGTVGATTPTTGAFTNTSYTGTLTGGTGIVNLGSGQLYKDASGNVGIGTASPAAVLHVSSSAVSSDIISENTNGGVSASNKYGFAIREQGAERISLRYFRDGTGNSQLTTVAALLVNVNSAERMRIDASGNVGIGTGVPRAKLDISNPVTTSVVTTGMHLGFSEVSGYGYTIVNENNPSATSAGNFKIQSYVGDSFVINNTGHVQVVRTLRTGGYTVATLPAGTQGMLAFVTDSLTPAFLALVVGGGAVVTPVFYNGTQWVTA